MASKIPGCINVNLNVISVRSTLRSLSHIWTMLLVSWRTSGRRSGSQRTRGCSARTPFTCTSRSVQVMCGSHRLESGDTDSMWNLHCDFRTCWTWWSQRRRGWRNAWWAVLKHAEKRWPACVMNFRCRSVRWVFCLSAWSLGCKPVPSNSQTFCKAGQSDWRLCVFGRRKTVLRCFSWRRISVRRSRWCWRRRVGVRASWSVWFSRIKICVMSCVMTSSLSTPNECRHNSSCRTTGNISTPATRRR